MAGKKLLTHGAYTVGWISALRCELNAARALLDVEHEQLQSAENDDNTYVLGEIGEHNVVIAFPGSGAPGTSIASQTITNMLRTFTRIRFGLLVGIGGGAPSPTKDIRLGDVVVSSPQGKYGGVFQFDMDKWCNGKFSIESHLAKPPGILLSAIELLKSDHSFEKGNINLYIQDVAAKASQLKAFKEFQFPGREQDRLFQRIFRHRGSDDCATCLAWGKPESRSKRESDEPIVHYGLIASTNNVLQSAESRDKLQEAWDISCIETETAGLMDGFPCVVIKGISDYSDDHRNKLWQPYAAVTAAAYAKDLLRTIKVNEAATLPPAKGILPSEQKATGQGGKTTGTGRDGGAENALLLQKIQQLEERIKKLETNPPRIPDVPRVEIGNIAKADNLQTWNRRKRSGYKVWTTRINFQKPFTAIPQVQVGLSAGNLESWGSVQYEEVDNAGFVVVLWAEYDSIARDMGFIWTAVGK